MAPRPDTTFGTVNADVLDRYTPATSAPTSSTSSKTTTGRSRDQPIQDHDIKEPAMTTPTARRGPVAAPPTGQFSARARPSPFCPGCPVGAAARPVITVF
jgi:hypothetical protein